MHRVFPNFVKIGAQGLVTSTFDTGTDSLEIALTYIQNQAPVNI